MSDLTDLRDHARQRANWEPGELRAACRDQTSFGTAKPADHANCGGCGCLCHEPTERERHLWRQIADEIADYLAPTSAEVDLFGEAAPEPTEESETA